MKIIAPIPVKKISNGITYYFECENIEVKVVRVIRYRADKYRERFYYQADIIDPPEINNDAIRCGPKGEYRVNISRKLNPKWRPPKFDGKNFVEFE